MRNSSVCCPACRNDKKIPYGFKNGFDLEKCSVCKTIFSTISLDDSVSASRIGEIYDHYYDEAKFELARAAEISLQNIVTTFENHRETGKLLDIGFGEGGMLTVAEKNRWQCFGTELSPHSLRHGEERGWIVAEDGLNDLRFPKGGFDVITMIELIEHVPDPDSFLQIAFELLRPEGLLFLTTPNIRSINQRVLGIDWTMIAPPEHLTIWSPSGMEKALERNGFTMNRIRTEGFNPIEIIQKLKRTKKEEKIHRNEAAFALNEAFTKSSWRQYLKSAINSGLSIARLGDGIKVWATRKNI